MAVLQKRVPKIEVRINGTPVDYLHPLSVGRSVNGRSLDFAELELHKFPQQPASRFLADIRLIDDLEQRRCEIFLTDESGKRRMVHWGYVDSKSVSIDRTERQIVQSRLQPYHFGDPLRGMLVWSPFVNDVADSLEQIVFNPQHDGRVWRNLGRANPANLSYLFIHPESQRSSGAVATNGSTVPVAWSLVSACHYLCWTANPGQRFIDNPTLTELARSLPLDEGILRNHRQPFGEYLPANLDALLEPYGYGWETDLSGGNPKIRVFRRGAGDAVFVNLQRLGDKLDLNKSNAEETGITTDVTNHLANVMEVYGDNIMVEGTWELQPGWNPAYDVYPLAVETSQLLDLHGGESKAWESKPELSRVWRDWVLNEAGDYTGARRHSGFFNFNFVAGAPLCFQAKRRKFRPCITLGADGRPVGEHHGIDVEYFRWDMPPVGTTPLDTGSWQPVEQLSSSDSISVQILDKECGIRFGGLHIPVDLANYGIDKARIRVTATVEMDARSWAGINAPNSPNIFRVVRVLDVSSRFKRRSVLPTSKFIEATPFASTAVNDDGRAAALASDLLANWNQASVSGTISIPSVDWEFASTCLGRPFKGIEGRGINFQTTQTRPAKYPSITAIKYDFVAKKITLSLDTWRRGNV